MLVIIKIINLACYIIITALFRSLNLILFLLCSKTKLYLIQYFVVIRGEPVTVCDFQRLEAVELNAIYYYLYKMYSIQ